MNANRILMFWMYYIISIFVVVCLAFILKKVKIVPVSYTHLTLPTNSRV